MSQPAVINPQPDKLKRVGMIARWRPVHLGHAAILQALCARSELALIGIGSSNRYNLRNPFTLGETEDMIRLVLSGHTGYQLIPVPDLDDGPRWRDMILDLFGPLDLLLTDNPYVASLMRDHYPLMRPVNLVPDDQRIAVDGRMVRQHMARGDGWQHFLPPPVASYISTNQLDQRFRQEFGLQTLALDTIIRK